jgi:hypothetical protein
MNRTRSIALCSVVILAALAILVLPGTVCAAPLHSSTLNRSDNTTVVDGPIQPTLAIPGVFSLKFGNDISTSQIEIPALNATASVTGLTLRPTLGWDSITLSQQQPTVTNAATISGTQVTVQGPETGYSATATAQVELYPSPAFQAEGTVGVIYDGVSKSVGVTLQDASMTVPTWPVGFALTGVNTGQGTLTIDSAQLGLPVAGSTVSVSGFSAGSSGTSWDLLTFTQNPNAPLKIGNVATISGVELSVPGTGTDQPATLSAHFDLNAGQVAHADGEVIGVKSPSGGPNGVALQDTNATVQIPGWSLQLAGINSVQGGVKIDTVSFAAEPINLTAEMSGVTIGAGGGLVFDEAQLTYLPSEGGTPAPGAFQLTMTRTDAGYVLTTTSLLPVAAR